MANYIVYQRRKTHEVLVGGLPMGGEQPVRTQTMCNTPTQDVEASVEQCKRIANAGADYVRLTTQGLREVEALSKIKYRLRRDGYAIPLIADVHFRADVALEAAKVADKVRINPGNFARTLSLATGHLLSLLDVCRHYGTALRIGVNHGSLASRILERFGNTPAGMVESAMELLQICQRERFPQVVVSMKASNVLVMVEAYRLLSKRMDLEAMTYPLHLGVTEAGNGIDGRAKSALGIGALLAEGIGDTVRVSLTEPPENEIVIAQKLIRLAPMYPYAPLSAHEKIPLLAVHYKLNEVDDIVLYAACEAGPMLIDRHAADLAVTATIAGKRLPADKAGQITDALLQAARIRFTKPDYIACPGCGRTLFDIEKTLDAIRAATARYAGIKIAVMGCIVNGPGEMADADYGYVGAGPGLITLYKGKTPVKKNIPEKYAVEELIRLIRGGGTTWFSF
ncbi:MAG: (E)-4-hydroxy-3-methylbut-2-enyl-diphosphate synthase [Prevotellaceae bacterium]|jgi:(E)-4-hydroxy-3-methylbut-2-enyl-diphosphate synthase|nr:(E)-4-hydroxy-3-methylbut-2-enyl-diphosphate synthase [Prevotellaceae bacterium]